MPLSAELSFLISAVISSSEDETAPENYQKLDWERIARLGEWHSIIPLLYAYVEKYQVSSIPDAILNELRSSSLEQAVSNMFFLKTSVSLYKKLQERNIRVFPIKGVVWAWLLYEKPGQREFGDIDLFIDPEQIDAALGVLKENGFEPDEYRQFLLKTEKLRKLYIATDYQLPLIPKVQNHVKSVEIQWDCTYPRYQYTFSWDQLMSKPVDFETLSSKIPVPSWEMQFVMMVIHHAGVEQWDKLKYFADFVRLLRKNARYIDWALVKRAAVDAGFYQLVLQSLGLVRKLTGENYFNYLPEENANKFPSALFYESIIAYWENTRYEPVTKSLQIFKYNIKYRDRLSDKLKIAGGHIHYLTKFALLLNKAIWYAKD